MYGTNVIGFLIISTGVILSHATAKHIPAFAGPYTIVALSTGNETNEFHSTGKYYARLYYSSPRPKQPQYVRGYFNSDVQVTNDMKIEIRMSTRSNNQWKRNAFIIKLDNACNALFVHLRFLLNFLFTPEERRCPLPKVALREVKNQTYIPTFPSIPVMPYGHYLFTMAIIRDVEVVGVSVSEIKLVPKL